MKTSNKILIGFIAFLSFSLLCFLIYAKSQMVPYDHGRTYAKQIEASGNVTKVSHEVSDFDAIDIGGNFEVFLKQGPKSILIEADDNVQKIIDPLVEETTLSFKMESPLIINNSSGLKIYISVENLKEITVHGFAKLQMDSTLNADNLSLKISDNSNINIENVIVRNDLNIIGRGFTKIKLSGSADHIYLDAKGNTYIDALGLDTREAKCLSSGFVKAKINAKDRLEIRASGNSEITYKGEPRISQSTQGFVNINQIQ